MSFNRLEYDTCAYAKELQESTSPLEYRLYLGNHENNNSCVCNPDKSLKCMVPPPTRTEVENELYNLRRPNHTSRCPEKKFLPGSEKFSHSYHTPFICEGIYHITPTNIIRPTTNGLNEENIKLNCCPRK